MNRKNPGLVEPEMMSKEEEHRYHRFYAIGCTIAAVLFTAFTSWEGHTKHASFGWFIAVAAWAFWWYEERQIRRRNLEGQNEE
jgi:Flp pilus assembly protein TadB